MLYIANQWCIKMKYEYSYLLKNFLVKKRKKLVINGSKSENKVCKTINPLTSFLHFVFVINIDTINDTLQAVIRKTNTKLNFCASPRHRKFCKHCLEIEKYTISPLFVLKNSKLRKNVDLNTLATVINFEAISE